MGTIARMDVRLAMDASDFEGGIAKAQRSAESLSAKLGKAGAAMSLGVTAPLAGIATMALKSAGDFEQSMNVMAQVTGATGAQMETLQAQALELGAVTSFSAGEAADAMLELGKAGLTPIEIGGAIAGTMDLAAAGNLGLAEAATITANALNAFQLPAEKAADVANLLAAAANASSVDVGDLAAGMQMAGAVFSANGQSLEDLTTAMAILGNNAITGSDAGTSLKTMLMRLSAPTDDAAAALADLGIQVFNADGSMRGFEDIVGQLERSTAGLSDQERNMALNTIFGADAIRAATILAREGADGFADMSKAVNKSGAAAATANARMKGIGGAVEYLKGSIDSFLIETALPFLDSLSGMVRGAADLLSSFSDLPAPIRNAALAFAGVAAAIGPVLLIASKLIPVFKMIGLAVGALASPFGLAVAAAVALGVAWATNFGGIQEKTTAVINSLRPAFDELGKWIDMASTGDFSGLQTEIGDALDSVKVAVANFKWSDFITALTDWGQFITATLSDWGAWITNLDWGTWIDTVLDWGAYITATLSDWGAYVAALDWGGYIQTVLDWGAYISDTLDDWGVYATVLDWADYITVTVTDWGAYIVALDWGGYIQTALDWGTYITATLSDWGAYIKALVWDDYVTVLWDAYITPIDWGAYISVIDWTAVTGTAIDWGEWIAALAWNVVISPIRWVTWVAYLVWSEFITKIAWGEFVPKVTDWKTFVPSLTWMTILSPITWSAFISSVIWTQFIPKINWKGIAEKVDWVQHIPVFAWPTFDAPDWVDFITALEWPTITAPSWSEFIDSLKWPTIPEVDWGDFIPDLSWPSIPSFPGWAAILAALGWGGPPSTSATTPPATGATTPPTGGLPNNGGYPVDVTPPAPNGIMTGGSAANIPTDFGGGWGDLGQLADVGAAGLIGPVYVTNEVDLAALAYQVAELLARRQR